MNTPTTCDASTALTTLLRFTPGIRMFDPVCIEYFDDYSKSNIRVCGRFKGFYLRPTPGSQQQYFAALRLEQDDQDYDSAIEALAITALEPRNGS